VPVKIRQDIRGGFAAVDQFAEAVFLAAEEFVQRGAAG
jgi:hypothetical protein